MRLLLVGPGRIGLSLAADLANSDAFGPIVVAGPHPSRPPFLEELRGVRYASVPDDPGGSAAAVLADIWRAPPEETALVLAVPDRSLVATAAGWAGAVSEAALPAAGVALHTSGFHPASALAELSARGWSAGSWHPLVAVAGPRKGAFRGRTVGVEGDARATAVAQALAGEVGGRPVRLRPGEKARWHAAAVLASNCLVACLSAAARELSIAAGEEVGLEDLLPLARSALSEVDARGLADGLTGPVARGDVATVAGHLAALDPVTANLYRPLAAELLRLASSRLEPDVRRALRAAIDARDFGLMPD